MSDVVGRDCFDMLMRARSFVHDMYGPVLFDKNQSIMEAVTDDNLYSVQYVIGVSELEHFPDRPMSMGKATVPLVNLFHEVCGHGGQICHEYSKRTNLSSVLAMNYYACKYSNLYYGLQKGPSHQYYHQPCEIAAEYMGIRCAYLFLEHEYGCGIADSMIEAYDAYRYDTHSGCVAQGPWFKSVDGLLDEFDSEFKKSIHAHRDYDLRDARDDNVWSYMLNSRENVNCLKQLSSRNDGLRQDWIMASLFVENRDFNERIQSLPALSRIDLSSESAIAFGRSPLKPKPKKRQMYLEDLHDTVDMLDERLHNSDELSL